MSSRYVVLLKDEYTGDQSTFGVMSAARANEFADRLRKYAEKVNPEPPSWWSISVLPVHQPTVKTARQMGWE